MPSAWARLGEAASRGLPPISTVPELAAIAPAAIAINVDFPAPFSPKRACTSPSETSRDTSSRATTPGKVLETPFRPRTARAVIGTALFSFAVSFQIFRRELRGNVGVRRLFRIASRHLAGERIFIDRQTVDVRLVVWQPLRGGNGLARGDAAKPRSCRHRAKLKLCITPFHLGIVAGELIALQQSEGNHRAVGALVRT